MNSRELKTVVEAIISDCKDIVSIADSVVVNRYRSARMREYACIISGRIEEMYRNTDLNNQRKADAVLLLSICLEDIKSFLEKFVSQNKDLAISIIKGGSHYLEFVKLSEQLQQCCIMIQLDIELAEDDGFDSDCSNLLSRLPELLRILFSESERSSLHTFVGKTRTLINNQVSIKNSYKWTSTKNDEVTMRSDDIEIVKPIGRGGFSVVWLGKFRGKQVAIKVLSVESSSLTVAEFQNEADLMRRLSNRNIVAYYGVTEIYTAKVSGHCMIMEYMSNDSLFTYIKNNRYTEMPWVRKVDIALDIASGIAFLHRLRIIHRDIKLGNILLDDYMHAKECHLQRHLPTAPECFGMNALYSTKSDIFAFSIVCWGLMHWELPFNSYDRESIRDMVWKERFRLPIDAKIPIAISSMIKLCWEQNYNHRPTMIEVREFLEKLVFIEGIQTNNPILASEMTTMSVIPEQKIASNIKIMSSALAESSKSNNGAMTEIPTIKNRNTKSWKGTNFLKQAKFGERKKWIIGGLILLIILIACAVAIPILLTSQKNANSNADYPSTSSMITTTKTKTIFRTPSPTATVTTVIRDTNRLQSIFGIAIDEYDNVFVATAAIVSNLSLPYPMIYKVNYMAGLNSTLTVIANLSTDGQGHSNNDQGLCYYNRALYVPRMGQLTKIDLDNSNMVTRFAGSGVKGPSRTGLNSSAVFNGAVLCIADQAGNIIVAEDTNPIRNVTQQGYVDTLINPTYKAYGFVYNGSDNLLFSSWNTNSVRNVNLKNLQPPTLAVGNPAGVAAEGPSNLVRLNGPSGMTYDELGNLYIVAHNNQAIWKLNTTNYLSRFAGSGQSGWSDGTGRSATFKSPRQIVFDSKGRLFVTDQDNSAVRMINW